MDRLSYILSTGCTSLGKTPRSKLELMETALSNAFEKVGLCSYKSAVDGIVGIPSLDYQFMTAHFLGTHLQLLGGDRKTLARTVDTGGASPVSALLQADWMIKDQGCNLVVVAGADKVSSMSTEKFLSKADRACVDPLEILCSPKIPSGYDRIAQWGIQTQTVTREQLAMAAVLMHRQASRHPLALSKDNEPMTLKKVLDSPQIAPVTNLYECAMRADAGAVVVVCSKEFLKAVDLNTADYPRIASVGEASGPLWVPQTIEKTTYSSCRFATESALAKAALSISSIDYFGLYDCFPVTFIHALEAVGLANEGCGGEYVEKMYNLSEEQGGAPLLPEIFPINTHGGLIGQGAPWEVPAMFSIIEAHEQITGKAENRQVPGASRALVYGNGGILSSAAVAILERSNDR